jgi:hypothetical protein
MTTSSDAANDRLIWIRSRLERADAQATRTRRANLRAIYASLFASTAATALAGFAVAANAPVGSWRITCGIVAILTFVAALSTGLQKQLDLTGNFSRLAACVGRLRALEYAVSMGTRSLTEVDAECEEIVRTYPEFVA